MKRDRVRGQGAAAAPSRRVRRRGQALVEFALVIPLFLTLFMGVVDVGRVVWANDSLANAAREGARFAIVHGGSTSDQCPLGPLTATYGAAPTPGPSCPYSYPAANGYAELGADRKQPIRAAAVAAAIAGGANVTATVCYGAGCTGDTDAAGADDRRGTPVTVAISSRLDLVVPSLLQLGSFTVTGTSTMLVNH